MDDGFMTGYVAGQNESNSGSGCGAWGDQWIWIIVVFALLFGWGNNGWGGNGGGNTMSYLPYAIAGSGALTRADLCQDMNFQGLENGVRNVSDAVNLGFANLNSTICNQQYETAGLINGLQGTIQGGFNAANIVALQNQNATQAQLAQCCCDERAAIADLKYTISTEDCATRTLIQNTTRDLIENQNAGVRSILDYLCQEKISDLQSENQALRLSASQTAQNQYLISQLRPSPNPAFVVPNPYTGAYGYQGSGYSCGYGCGCNCVG